MEDRISSLEIALRNETKEREFYLAQAQKTQNPLGRAIFTQIADEEREHYEKLKELKQLWENKGKWPETVPLVVNGTEVGRILDELTQKVANGKAGTADDLAAVRIAIEFEAAGAKFYQKLQEQVSDPLEKNFFAHLAKIEREHFLSLKDTEEYLSNPAAWYRKAEGTSLDGA